MNEKLTVLITTEFHEHSEGVRRAALNLCRRLNARADLLHVMTETYRDPAWRTPMVPLMPVEAHYEFLAGRKMSEIARFFVDNGIETETVVGRGGVAETILKVADSAVADLIVMGSKPRTAVSGLLGGTVEHVVRRAPCPVIVIPHDLKRCCGAPVPSAQYAQG